MEALLSLGIRNTKSVILADSIEDIDFIKFEKRHFIFKLN
jgi:hypothetical protein